MGIQLFLSFVDIFVVALCGCLHPWDFLRGGLVQFLPPILFNNVICYSARESCPKVGADNDPVFECLKAVQVRGFGRYGGGEVQARVAKWNATLLRDEVTLLVILIK